MSSVPNVARPLRTLHVGFWGSIVSFGLVMGTEPALGASVAVPFATNVLLATFVVFALLYWTALGVLAHRTGRNWLVWVVAGLATFAIGFIVTYALMVSRTRNGVSAGAARDRPSRNSRDSA
jgi:NAD/NADP transhydrogenase beta subunit